MTHKQWNINIDTAHLLIICATIIIVTFLICVTVTGGS